MAESVTMFLQRRTVVLGAVLGVAAVAALLGGVSEGPGAAALDHPGAAPLDHPGAAVPTAVAPPGAPDGAVIEATVAEKLDVTQYSYLRLALDDGAEIWAAVPRSEVAVGARVVVREPQLMEGFVSPTLGREFERIYFGTLDPGAAAPAVDGGVSGRERRLGAAPGALGSGGAGPSPVGEGAVRPSGDLDDVEVGAVARAEGPTGSNIAEAHQRRASLAGKPVRVRGVVVRTVPGVLGRSFVHLRDGSGDAAQGTHDLTVTTAEQPEPGQTVLYEGTLAVDRDFGAGYRYPVLLEDARSVAAPR